MSLNIEGTMLSELRHSMGTTTVQPSSDPVQAEKAAQESQIQEAELQPTLPVPEQIAFDQYQPSFAEKNEVREDPLAVARLNNQSEAVKESLEVPDEVEYTEGRSGPVAEHLAEISVNSVTHDFNTNVEVDVLESTADKVSETVQPTSLTEQKYGTTDASVQVHGTILQSQAKQAEVKSHQHEPVEMPEMVIETPLEEYQAHPLHQQTSIEVVQTMEERDSAYLHPERDLEMFTTPDTTLQSETSVLERVDSLHRPTFGEKSLVEMKAEETFQDGVVDQLEQKARETTKQMTMPDINAAALVGLYDMPNPTANEPLKTLPMVEVSGDNIQKAVQEAQSRRATNPVTQERQQNNNFSQSEQVARDRQSRENSGLTGGRNARNSVNENAGDSTRPQLQSQAEVYAQEATQNTNYEPIPVATGEETNFEPVLLEYNPPEYEPVLQDSPEFEPQLIEVEGIDPELLVNQAEQGRPSPSEVSADYTPPVFQETEFVNPLEDNPVFSEDGQDFFPPLPGSSENAVSADEIYAEMLVETTVSQEAIAEYFENDYEMAEEYNFVDPSFDYEPQIPELSQQQLAYLRNNAVSAEYTPELLRENETPVDIDGEEAWNILEEQWVPSALNMETNIRFSTNIGTAEVDVVQFQEVYELPDTMDFSDYDYNLVANRVVEAAMANAPQELYDTFVG